MDPHQPHSTQPSKGHASQGDSAGPPHLHTRAHCTRAADRDSPPKARRAGGGTAPEFRRRSQVRKAPPPETPSRHPNGAQRCLARAHAVGLVLGPDADTDRTPEPRVAEPSLPAPRDERPGEGQRLTPDAPHSCGRPPPWGGHQPGPRQAAPRRACNPKGRCWAPTPAHPRPQHVSSGPRQPAQRTGSRGRGSA